MPVRIRPRAAGAVLASDGWATGPHLGPLGHLLATGPPLGPLGHILGHWATSWGTGPLHWATVGSTP